MDQRIIRLYDEYTHAPLERRVFLKRLSELAGGTAAAAALLPLLENNYAKAAIVAPDDARLETGYVTYKGATGDLRAYVAKQKNGPAKRPAIVIIHENRGLHPHIEDVVRRTALEGFTAFGPDLLSPQGGTPADEDAARDLFSKIDRGVAVQNLLATVAYVRARPDVTDKIGCIGFCWGGGMGNLLVVNSPDLVAAVQYYGQVPNPADVPKIRARLLLHYAGLDERINAGIPGYEAALKGANVAYTMYMYEGVNHAFNNDVGGARYDKPAAELAWNRSITFLKENLAD